MLLEQQISILEWFLKCNNISQYYCFYCIFDLINAAMVNVRDVFQNQNKMVWLLTFEQKCDRNTWHVKHPLCYSYPRSSPLSALLLLCLLTLVSSWRCSCYQQMTPQTWSSCCPLSESVWPTESESEETSTTSMPTTPLPSTRTESRYR